MSHLCILLWVLAAPRDSPISNPLDVHSVVRGAQAVTLDPASASQVDGAELSLRTRGDDPASHARQWGLYGVAPLGALSLLAGYEWLSSDFDYQRATLGLGLDFSSLSLGLDYRHLHKKGGGSAGVWDASLLASPASWVSLALGIERMNDPHWDGVLLAHNWYVGAGLRPLAGAPWLTLGADADFRLARHVKVFTAPRFVLDVAPIGGLHARVGYAPDGRQLWVGVSAALASLETSVAAGGNADHWAENGSAGAALTLRTAPAESSLELRGRTIDVPLNGKLRPSANLLRPAEPISELPLALARLADDASVGRVVLAIGDLDVGNATVEELRSAVRRLRAAGKEVVAELAGGSEKEYLVAAACDRIRLDPSTNLVLDGYAVTLLYFADAFAKIGVRFDAVEIGRYKTAPDALTRSSPRPEEREVTKLILAQLFRHFVEVLVRDRHLDEDAVREVLARGLVTPAEALKLHLVDELTQPTDPKALPMMHESGEALSYGPPPSQRWGAPPVIAVVPLVGNITASGAAGLLPGGAAEASRLVRELEQVRHDPLVRAVVLRIDSPGGEVYASEVIWRAVRLVAAAKPLVVSMGEVAASGGYYVATPAQVILAEPSTITGSIGIFMVKPDLSGLLKVTGVHADLMEAGPHAAWSSILKGLTDEERAIARGGLEAEYETFLQRVAQGRHLPLERVRELAEGRVYTGEEALGLGLVDGIGGLTDAVAEARERAGLSPQDDVEVRVVTARFSLGGAIARLEGATHSPVESLTAMVSQAATLAREPLARLPFEVIVSP